MRMENFLSTATLAIDVCVRLWFLCSCENSFSLFFLLAVAAPDEQKLCRPDKLPPQ